MAREARWSVVGALVLLAACGGGDGPRGSKSPLSTAPGLGGRIEVKEFAERPRLTLVSREGDPVPAVVAAVVTDLGPVATTALAALVEGRVRAKGVEVDTRVARNAFRVRYAAKDAAQAKAFFVALAEAFARPASAGAPELALVAQRLASLRRNPLDAPELLPVVSCTGALGIAANEAAVDVAMAAGLRELEGWRQTALGSGRTSLAAVGPESFTAAVTSAVERSSGWPAGAAAGDPPKARGEGVGAYAAASLGKRLTRVTLAVDVGDPATAAIAAERLAADGALGPRLEGLAEPFRLVEVTGAARRRGGCLSVVLEGEHRASAGPVEAAAALAAATARKEMSLAIARGAPAGVATREILTAADPREAASRAAWWAIAEVDRGQPEAWAVALGVSPADRGGVPDGLAARFREQLARAVATNDAKVAERRLTVERGQGELWLLLASPCGVAEEGPRDAGSGAIAAIASVERQRDIAGVRLEAWVTADGIGVLAHAPFRDERESPVELARRVADGAARALTASAVSNDAAASARSLILDRLEQGGRQGAAFEALARALSPDHPSWIEPFGVWSRVASGGLEHIRLRSQALGAGPLRVAVLANADSSQAVAAADAVDRWLSPSVGERTCRASAASSPRTGSVDARLPSDATLAQALVAAPLVAQARGYAELAATALAADGGPLARALRDSAAGYSARVVGGPRASALVVDVRAAPEVLASAAAQAKFTLMHLGETLTEADVARANALLSRRDVDARMQPRTRLAELWSGGAVARPQVSLPKLREWLASSVREGALVMVEAHPD